AGRALVGAVEETTDRELRDLMELHFFGPTALVRAVLPHMRRQRSGRILNFSSIGGYRGGSGFGVYCSTKFAVEGLTEALADELRPLGIYPTAIEPGYFRTDFLDSTSLSVSPIEISDYAETAGVVRSKAREISHNQPGNPDKLAEVVISFADAKEPPVRLPLGSDTVAAIEAKHASDRELLAQWRQVSISTDFQQAR
ncbi:MAG: SDR family NAD(P)-dependent oxidoreductase, partial [Ensifer adhaerens]